MRHLRTYRLFESTPGFDDYEPDPSLLQPLIDNARKWKEKAFVEEYVYIYGLNTVGVVDRIRKGDEIEIGIVVKDKDGKHVYKDSIQAYAPYKTIVADKDYSNIWQFVLDNAQELQDEARKLWAEHSKKSKPAFKKNKDTITAYHASPYKFDKFESQDEKTSGQIGADMGFFFFLDKKNAEYYARVLAENKGKSYLYEVWVNPGEQVELDGENVGTNWGRVGELEQQRVEGYDSVIIRNADTGYGITDELVVFDDDSIKINNVREIKS